MNLGYCAKPIGKIRFRLPRSLIHSFDLTGRLIEIACRSSLTVNQKNELTEVGHRYSLSGCCLSRRG
jgi:hypothetical protein